MIALEGVVFLALPKFLWTVSFRHLKRQLIALVAILLLVYFICISPPMVALATQGLTYLVSADSGVHSDVIVVLGRGEILRNQRVEIAVQLWQAQRAPKIFASGMGDAPQMIDFFKAKGIPHDRLSGESCSQSTEENALFAATMLQPQGIQQILLITDPPHMLRSSLTLRSFGFTVVPHMSPMPPSLTSRQRARLIFREYLGIISYAFLGRFQKRLSFEIERPPADVLRKLSAWRCYF